jgi:formate dehydrogenase subunit gamma
MSATRLWAGIASVVFAVLLVVVAVVTFGPEEPVMPEESVTAGQNGSESDALAILRQRTGLQNWRTASGPSPEGEAPGEAGAREPGQIRFGTRGMPENQNPEQLVRSWEANPPGGDMMRPAENIVGISSLPYAEAGTFEQPGGRDWRQSHNDELRYGGGWVIFGVALALALFLFFRGRIPLVHGYSGERIERFNASERANHWMTAVSFILMALTGLVLLYGKPLLLPLIGHDALGSLSRWSAWLHMASVIPFVLGVLVMIALWLIPNLPDRYDGPWLRRFGGFLSDSGDHPPAGRFNTGRKLVVWAVVLGGLALLGSGIALMFPFYWLGYDGMQWAQIAHTAVGLLMIALMLGHIYIGSVGMEDAFEAMWSGKVDRNWLREHHSVWYEEISGKEGAAKEEKSSSSGGQQQPAE